MNYQTYQPHTDLSAFVKYYWTLEVPYDPKNYRQKIIPDGCIEMTFNLKEGIKRYISDTDFVVHPKSMVMGQRTKSYFIEPLGDVDSFAVCFYPYGFTHFVNTPLAELLDLEVPLSDVFKAETAFQLEKDMYGATSTNERIRIIENFLFSRLNRQDAIENLVKTTVDALLVSKGRQSIGHILENQLSKRRQLERNFRKQIGISPKQLGKVLRLQTALKFLLSDHENLTNIAYESEYFDQAHFIKDFKEFIGTTPKEFLGDKHMELSSLFYKD